MLDIPAASITDLLAAIPTPTTTQPGVAPLATSAEVALGVDPSKIITPAALYGSRCFVQADRNGVSRGLNQDAWTQIACSNVTADQAKAWSTISNYFTAPYTALFRFEAKLRLADAASADQVGLTVDTIGRDGSYAVWADRASTGNRYVLTCERTMMLTAGTQVAMYGYSPNVARTISNASIVIYRV